MRLLSYSLILMVLGLCLVLMACSSDDDNPASSPTTEVSTFWRTYDLGEYEYMGSIASVAGGATIVGGTAQIEHIDSSGPTPVTYSRNEAMLVSCRPDGDTIWTNIRGERQYSESIGSVIDNYAGGCLAIVAQSYYGGPGSDFTLQRFGDDGTPGTFTQVNDTQFDDVYDIRECSDGNFIMAGRYWNFGIRSMAYYAKADPSAGIIWHKTFAYPNVAITGRRIFELPDSTLVLASTYDSLNGTGDHLHTLRLSATGDSLYATVTPMGGELNVLDVAAVADGGYKLLLSQFAIPAEYAVYTVARFDNLGTVKAKQISYGGNDQYPGKGSFTSDGGAILCGHAQTGVAFNVGLLVKLDASGVVAWERTFADPEASVSFYNVIQTERGGYLIAGNRRLLLDDSYESLLARADRNGRIPEAP